MHGEFDEGEYQVVFGKYQGEDEIFEDCWEERWTKDSVLHRIGGPAITIRDAEGNAILEEFYQHNELHCSDGPARIKLNGDFKTESWFQDGGLHREGAPCETTTYLPSSMIVEELWATHGIIGRTGGPAKISRHETSGTTIFEAWFSNGAYHRDDGVAVIWRNDQTGIAEEERYYRNGVLDREDGPAAIYRNGTNGDLIKVEYFRRGEVRPEPSAG